MIGVLLAAGPVAAEDSDQLRYYLAVRAGESLPFLDAHDVTGYSLGANITRFFGADVAFDKYELFVTAGPNRKLGEVQVFSILPEVRLRYPLFGDRLVPYFLGGLGVSIDHINDAVVPSGWSGGGSTRYRLVGAVAGGVEYYVSDDIAFGVEGKYFMLGSATYETADTRTKVNLDAGVFTLGMRVLYPELHPDPEAFFPERFRRRIYLSVRAGGALLMKGRPFASVDTHQSHEIFGSNFGRAYGLTIGVQLSPRWDVELAGSYNEPSFRYPNGRHSEYAIFPLLAQGRLHALLENPRVDPYALFGAGAVFTEINDKSGEETLQVTASQMGVTGSLGAGIDYRLTRDVSFGLEAKYLWSRSQTLTLADGTEESGNLDSLWVTLGVRAYFAEL